MSSSLGTHRTLVLRSTSRGAARLTHPLSYDLSSRHTFAYLPSLNLLFLFWLTCLGLFRGSLKAYRRALSRRNLGCKLVGLPTWGLSWWRHYREVRHPLHWLKLHHLCKSQLGQQHVKSKGISLNISLIVPLGDGLSPISTNHSSDMPLIAREEDKISLRCHTCSVSSRERNGRILLMAREVHSWRAFHPLLLEGAPLTLKPPWAVGSYLPRLLHRWKHVRKSVWVGSIPVLQHSPRKTTR